MKKRSLKSMGGKTGIQRKAMPVDASAEPVRMGSLSPTVDLPALLQPGGAPVDIFEWLGEHRDEVMKQLLRAGAVLFRGFRIDNPASFQRFIQAASDETMLTYTYRSTPRTHLGDQVYTSTEYPADEWIMLHNENAYSRRWPRHLWFSCNIAAATGGETPLADSRDIYKRMPASIRDEFEAKGIMYTRNYGSLDLPWQEVFGTDDPAQVEAFCRDAEIDFQWLGGGELRTTQVCQAAQVHPETGDKVWFNQAHLFHESALPKEIRGVLRARYASEQLPRNAFYGDGSPIADETIQQIQDVMRENMVRYPWQVGDVLMVDNLLAAHGRAPFTGERKIIVAMTA